MAALFKLEIVTPERQFYSGQVEALIVDTPDGERGIYANHVPMIIALDVGRISIKDNQEWKSFFASEGFVEIRKNETIIMAQAVETQDEIDVRRAEEAKRKAEERLRQRESLLEYDTTMSSLARAMARLRVKKSENID